MEKANIKKHRGGARPGAGRKVSQNFKVSVGIRLDESLLKVMETYGIANKSEFCRTAVAEKLSRLMQENSQ